MYPISAQNVKLRMNPNIQIASTITILFTFFPIGVSLSTVEIASTNENVESIPNRNKVKNNKIFQKLAPGISEAAVGKATNASPIYAT